MKVRQFLRGRPTAAGTTIPYIGNAATAAIEMALWDICGKALGCPVHQFFGGLDTENVPFYWYIWVRTGQPRPPRRRRPRGWRAASRPCTSRSAST